jgi:hypothetical protein
MLLTSNFQEIRHFHMGAGETGECETGTWKEVHEFEPEVRDCEWLPFPTGRGDERQEFRALLERMQRRAGRPGIRQRG